MKSNTKFISLFLCGCIAVIIIFYVCLCFYLNHGYLGLSYNDFNAHWLVRARAIGFQPLSPDGKLITAPTVPWALIVGQIFYAGFMPLHQAQIFNTLLHVIVYLFTAYLLYELLKKDFDIAKIFILCLLPIAQFSFMYSLWFGNEGAIICLLMIDIILLMKKHPYIAGIILSVCMSKPQIAAIFCVMFIILSKNNYGGGGVLSL